MATDARHLHDITQDKDWIKETVAASGGLGGDYHSIWTFWLPNYAALDRLLKDYEDEVSKAYYKFFGHVPRMTEMIKEKVYFVPKEA